MSDHVRRAFLRGLIGAVIGGSWAVAMLTLGAPGWAAFAVVGIIQSIVIWSER